MDLKILHNADRVTINKLRKIKKGRIANLQDEIELGHENDTLQANEKTSLFDMARVYCLLSGIKAEGPTHKIAKYVIFDTKEGYYIVKIFNDELHTEIIKEYENA